MEKTIMEDPSETYNNIRKAAEVHRQVRQYARKHIRPGMSLTEIANDIEDAVRALVEENGMEGGIGFPTGLNINNCAAHFSPNAGDKTSERILALLTRCTDGAIVLQQGDVLKVDIGVQVKGRICDSAFTLNWEPTYDKLLEAVKAATNTGLRVRSSMCVLSLPILTRINNRKQALTSAWASSVVSSRRPWSPMRSK